MSDAFIEDFLQYRGIALSVFRWCFNRSLAREHADYATKIAILTHDPEKSTLSTHVYYTAWGESNKLRRQLIKDRKTNRFFIMPVKRKDGSETCFEKLLANKELSEKIWEEIQILLQDYGSAKKRYTILRRYSSGESYAEIGRSLNLSRSAVQQQFVGAIKILRKSEYLKKLLLESADEDNH